MGNCCRCRCHPSKSQCCHCRIAPELPDPTNDEIDIDKVMNTKDYNKWLNQSQVQEGRRWFYWVTLYVDLYCWVLILGYCLGTFMAHLIPVLHWVDPTKHENWVDCKSNVDGSLIISCVVLFHFCDATPTLAVIAICVYILRNWNYFQLDLFFKLIVATNVLNLLFFYAEFGIVWKALINDAPALQQWTLFGLASLILIGVFFGWWIMAQVYGFLSTAQDYHIEYPTTESQIVSLIREAQLSRGKLRVIGSKHSAPPAIYVDDLFAHDQIMMSLDHYTGIQIIKLDEEEAKETGYVARAVAKGGTCLGYNRENPLSKRSNGLVYILEKEGYSLADLGGVVMQTVGGFTAMGCAGGTIYHDYYESIHSIRILDGTGQARTYIKPTYEEDPEYNDPYWGVCVSMGLMGIISEVTYNLKPSYNVLGSQLLWPVACKKPKYPISWEMPESDPQSEMGEGNDGTGPLDLYASNDSPNSVYQLIMNPENRFKSEYMRIFAWPQVEPALVTLWKGHREQLPHNPKGEWSNCYGKNGEFIPRYYHEVGDPETGKGGVTEQKLLSFFYNFFDHFTNITTMMLPDWAVKTVQTMIRAGNPDSSKGGQYFGAGWAHILPMDEEMWTQLLPIQFTELWFDIEDTGEVMQCLKEYWAENEGMKHTGTFSWEFYPAKAGGYSDKEKGEKPGGAWLRPGYERTSFRVDALWFDVKTEEPYLFFEPLWNKFIDKKLYFRPHWAKWFAGGNVKFPGNLKGVETWSDYYASQYPKWDKWMELRAELDPNNVFLSTFWSNSLYIPDAVTEVRKKDMARKTQEAIDEWSSTSD